MASFKMTNTIEVKVSDRISVKVGLSSLYKTSSLEVSRLTPFGVKRRLFLTPLQYHSIVLNEFRVNAIVKGITADMAEGKSMDEDTLYSIPLDPRKSISIEVFKGKIYVIIHTYKNSELQKGLAFNLEYSNEFKPFMDAKEKVIEALDEVKQTMSLTAIRESKSLTTYTWTVVNNTTGKKHHGRRLYFSESTAYDLATRWATDHNAEDSSEEHTPCIIERKVEWPSADILFRCGLLALVSQSYDDAMKTALEEDSATVYGKARGGVTLKMVERLLREIFTTLGDSKRFEGLDTLASLSPEEETDLQRLVVEKLHNSLTAMELSVFLTCYDIAGAEYYPDHICGWFTEVKEARTSM